MNFLLERWRPVLDWTDRYWVSDFGRVAGIRGVRKLDVRQNGYVQVLLYAPGVRSSKLVHRLVLESFIGSCPDGMEACHRNGDRSDNKLQNLRWDTKPANMLDRDLHGRTARGSANGFAKGDEGLAQEIIRRYRAGGITQKDLASELGVHKCKVNEIVNGKRWRHVSE